VLKAFQCARPGDVVLLAPACSSFDQFQDYEHRGRVFKELVERLAKDIESGSVEWKWKPEGRVETGAPGTLALAATPPSQVGLQEAALEPPPDTAAESGNFIKETARTEDRPHEPTLVYEISAEELPPAEIEPARDYSAEPETSQPQEPCTPERTDDVQLPYEARADEKGVAASGSAGREFAEGGSKDMSSPSERSAAITDKRKPKSAAPDSAPQPRLPGMD
jgi:hypothetical protein